MTAIRKLSLFEMRDEDGSPYFELPGQADVESMSVRRLCDARGGDQSSGAQRANATAEVEEAVRSFFDTACRLEGEERATVLTLHLVARDRTYEPATWLREKLALHRDACAEEFHRPDHDRQTDEAWEPRT